MTTLLDHPIGIVFDLISSMCVADMFNYHHIHIYFVNQSEDKTSVSISVILSNALTMHIYPVSIMLDN